MVKNKIIVDAGAGCFALGILAAKAGAKLVIGTDISQAAINCAQENIIRNIVSSNSRILKENGLAVLLAAYMHKVDCFYQVLPPVMTTTLLSNDFIYFPLFNDLIFKQ